MGEFPKGPWTAEDNVEGLCEGVVDANGKFIIEGGMWGAVNFQSTELLRAVLALPELIAERDDLRAAVEIASKAMPFKHVNLDGENLDLMCLLCYATGPSRQTMPHYEGCPSGTLRDALPKSPEAKEILSPRGEKTERSFEEFCDDLWGSLSDPPEKKESDRGQQGS